jgi:hypothetical protein
VLRIRRIAPAGAGLAASDVSAAFLRLQAENGVLAFVLLRLLKALEKSVAVRLIDKWVRERCV